MAVITITLNPCIDKTFAVERVVPDRKLTGQELREYPGGGGINVARAVTRLGARAHALWSAGGNTGERLAQLLDAEHVPHTPIPISGEVRENLIVRDSTSEQQYRFGMPGPTLGESDRARWLESLRGLPSDTEYVVVSGSLPGETPSDWYAELFRALPANARIVVDTKKAALKKALTHGVFLIKPNVHEFQQAVGAVMRGDEPLERAARDIVDRGGARVVVVSLGRGGALMVTAEGCQRLPAASVPIRSKVGAGDSMVGGIVTALSRGFAMHEAVRFGMAAGTAATMTEGTELCRREDTERLYESAAQRGG